MKEPKHTIRSLAGLMSPIQQTGNNPVEVRGLTTDSRRVVPGALFFALPGLHTDGNFFVEEAIDRGAVGIVSENPGGAHRNIAYIQVEDVRTALALTARQFFGDAASRLAVIGITGTNGKTTVATLAQHFLVEEGKPVGLIGTIRYDVGHRTFPSFKTTPESVDIHAMLAQMESAGCREVVMEVSSHGIEQKRVEGLPLDTAVFLNLTQDHLDYHRDMANYFECKARIFTGKCGQPLPGKAFINTDDASGESLLQRIPGEVAVRTFGSKSNSWLQAVDLELTDQGTRFTLSWEGAEYAVESPLLGAFNVSNVLAALAIALGRGRKLETILSRLRTFPGVPGRMEKIEEGQPFRVLVDYAHTDDALRNALGMLRPIVQGKLRVVFGCGGNRDREKRPLMTRAVLETADVSYLTADNPRKEKLEQIFQDMEEAIRPEERTSVHIIEDRRRAIHQALLDARPGDCVLIAGKGHETFQEFADTLIPFDDRAVARELIRLSRLAETGRENRYEQSER